ncbi:MAG TPA: prohibitin family protein [Methanocella sp.]|nr:prohibitin family protein [Methanocella sp.]
MLKDNRAEGGLTVIGIIAIIVIILFIAISVLTFRTVSAGNVGVKDTFGNVDQNALNPGAYFLIAPWTGIVQMSTQRQLIDMTGGNALPTLTDEGVSINVEANTWYHIDPKYAPQIYSQLGTDFVNTQVIPEIRTAVRDEVAKYDAETLYSGDRGEINNAVINEVNSKLNKYGVYIDDFGIRKVDLPQSLQDSINAKQTAQQQIQQQKFQTAISIEQANQTIIKAQGIAQANRILSDSLDDRYLKYYAIEQLYANKNVTLITDGNSVGLNKIV